MDKIRDPIKNFLKNTIKEKNKGKGWKDCFYCWVPKQTSSVMQI